MLLFGMRGFWESAQVQRVYEFISIVPAAWNSVPGEIRQAKTAQAFKKAYKVHRRNMVAIS